MGRPERPVDPDGGPLQRFAYDLRTLRREAGQPSYRELAKRAHYSDTTLSVAAGGTARPSLAATLAFVRACGGDTEEWERRWHALAAEAASNAIAASEQAEGQTSLPAGGRRPRWRRTAAAALGAGLAIAVATVALTTLGGPRVRPGDPHVTSRPPGAAAQPRDRPAPATTMTAGPGCSPQAGASFAAHGAWRPAGSHGGQSGAVGPACGGQFLAATLTSGAASAVAEWSFATRGARDCSLLVYLPRSSQAAGIATYDVYGAGQRRTAQFTVDQGFDQGLAFAEGPYRATRGDLRVRLANSANGTLVRPIAAAAIQVSCKPGG